jgi:hypothetical protein
MAEGGIDCVEKIAHERPDLLVLEAPLLWGGSDGVLEILEASSNQRTTRVIIVAVGPGSIDWFQLSRFRVDDLLFRIPTAHELERAIGSSQPGIPSPHCDVTTHPTTVLPIPTHNE